MKNVLRAALLAVFMLCGGTALAEMVNINKADAAALMENLPGIGETKAKAIVKYRKENGNFKSIDGLLDVPGIGEKTFANLKSEVSVSKGAAKATGKKPITSVNQTGTTKKSSTATSEKTSKKDSKSADKADTKSSSKSKSSDKDSKSKSESKSTKKAGKTEKQSDSKDAKAKSDSKSSKKKSSSKSKSTTKASSKKKPKPKASPKPKKSTKKKKKKATKKQ